MIDSCINTQQHIIMYILYSIDYMVHSSLQLCSLTFLRHVHARAQCENIYVMGWTPHCQCHLRYSHLAQAFQEVDTPSHVCLLTHTPGWRCTDTTGTSCPVLFGWIIFRQNSGVNFHQVPKQCFCVTVLLQINTSWVVLEVEVVMHLYVVHFLEILSQSG